MEVVIGAVLVTEVIMLILTGVELYQCFKERDRILGGEYD